MGHSGGKDGKICFTRRDRSGYNRGAQDNKLWNESEEKGMDVKEQIKKAVDKITKDKQLQEQFWKEPVKALESVLGVDLPDDVIDQVIQGVKAKLTTDKLSDSVDALKDFLKK